MTSKTIKASVLSLACILPALPTSAACIHVDSADNFLNVGSKTVQRIGNSSVVVTYRPPAKTRDGARTVAEMLAFRKTPRKFAMLGIFDTGQYSGRDRLSFSESGRVTVEHATYSATYSYSFEPAVPADWLERTDGDYRVSVKITVEKKDASQIDRSDPVAYIAESIAAASSPCAIIRAAIPNVPVLVMPPGGDETCVGGGQQFDYRMTLGTTTFVTIAGCSYPQREVNLEDKNGLKKRVWLINEWRAALPDGDTALSVTARSSTVSSNLQ